MLARAGSLVVEAEKLRRRSSPLENEAVLKLIEEARRKLGLVRRIQVVVTEQLTSPAVMGWVAPVLILPLSMVTTLPMGQLQLILLHELAHIRRGDYLVQFVPASGRVVVVFQSRRLVDQPANPAGARGLLRRRGDCAGGRTIAIRADTGAGGREALAAAPAFGDRRNPSGLKDRIQRLLVPGYRPALQLTWRALLVALCVGGGLLYSLRAGRARRCQGDSFAAGTHRPHRKENDRDGRKNLRRMISAAATPTRLK